MREWGHPLPTDADVRGDAVPLGGPAQTVAKIHEQGPIEPGVAPTHTLGLKLYTQEPGIERPAMQNESSNREADKREPRGAGGPSLPVHGGRRRGKLLALVALVAVVALVAGGVLVQRQRQRSAAQQRAEDAWATLVRCLWGAPLARSESAQQRLRRIELAEGLTANDDPPPEAWPLRCTGAAERALDAWRASASAGLAQPMEVPALLEAAVTQLRDGRLPVAQALYDAASRTYQGMGRADPAVPIAPTPMKLSLDIQDATSMSGSLSQTPRRVGGRAEMLIDDSGELVHCVAGRSTPLVSCYRPGVPSGQLIASHPTADRVLLTHGGIYDSRRRQYACDSDYLSSGEYLTEHNVVLSMRAPPGQPQLLVSRHTGDCRTAGIVPPQPDAGPHLLFNQILWIDQRGKGPFRLIAQELLEQPPYASPPAKVGDVPRDMDWPEACRTDQALFVVLANGAGDGHVAVYEHGRWTFLAGLQGARRFHRDMSCAGDRLALTELTRETRAVGKLRAAACTLRGCLNRTIALPGANFQTSSESSSNDWSGFAVLLGERFLLAWWERSRTRFAEGDARDRRTLWMRLARLEELGRARSTALLDLDASEYPRAGARAIPGGQTVTVVLLAKDKTTWAFRVQWSGGIEWLRFVAGEKADE
jgi:hypothetical protein